MNKIIKRYIFIHNIRSMSIFLTSLVSLRVFTACQNEKTQSISCGGDHSHTQYVVRPEHFPPPPWPEWALTQWVWEDESTRESAFELVSGYLEHGISLGAVIIDSPWETGYNAFEFDSRLYPDAEGMIEAFHDQGVRVFFLV